MKKLKILSILSCLFLLTGCGRRTNSLDNAKIYTTIYPVTYITNYLYGDNSVIESIYPDGVDINSYTLTDKQLSMYSEGNLFVYVGCLSKEKSTAKAFRDKSKKILFSDATYRLEYEEDVSEMWLSPNNFLMMLKNVKNSLVEYLNNTVKEETIIKKYDELYEKISWIGIDLKEVGKDAKENGNNTLIVASNKLKFLKKYNFNVISLEDIENSKSDKALNDIKNKFKNSTYKKILKLDIEEDTTLMQDLQKNCKANIVELNSIISNSDSASDYVSIQYENIALIRDILSV